MSVFNLMVQPLTISKIGGSTLDAYGNTVPSPVGAPVAVKGYLEQSESVETLNDRDTVVSTWQVFLPAGTNVNAFDRVGFNGQTSEVDGAPWQVFNPRTGAVSHIQAKLKVVQ